MGGFEITNRNERRAEIAAGGWTIVWGDLLNEGDILKLAVSLGTGTPGIWVQQQLQAQLVKFGQSLSTVSDDVVKRATAVLEDALKHKLKGEWDIGGLGIKAGIVTYNRWWQITIKLPGGKKIKVGGKNPLPNNHQPYIGLRVAKPLPSKGADAMDIEMTGGESPAATPVSSRSASPAPVN